MIYMHACIHIIFIIYILHTNISHRGYKTKLSNREDSCCVTIQTNPPEMF